MSTASPTLPALFERALPTRAELLSLRYGMLALVVVCQAATLLISWPAWNVRSEPVNLPLLALPPFSFGILLLLSLAGALLAPRYGVLAHAVLVLLACVWDQYRVQPQVISLVVLMLGCVFAWGTWFARWYLAAMWLWAGIHKLTSRDWNTWDSWHFLESCGFDGDSYYSQFAIAVAIAEIGLGIAAIVAPRWAALGCIGLHLGLLVLLSPLFRNYNPSVWPWNFATAIVGAWILYQPWEPPRTRWRYAIVTVLLLLPAGYWLGLVNAHLAFVLYSGNLPHAYHTDQSSVKTLSGWTGLTVPFPDSPRLFRQAFAATAEPGDKLYINDPRWGMRNRYFVMLPNREVREITRAAFRQTQDGQEVVGIEQSAPQALWRAQRAGVSINFDKSGLEQAAELSGNLCTNETLELLRELPNLRELRVSDGAITDHGLAVLADLPRLEIFVAVDCPLSAAALEELARCPALGSISTTNLSLSGDALHALANLPSLSLLQLPGAKFSPPACAQLGQLQQLEWLDLSAATLPADPLASLVNLPKLQWLTLTDTKIDAAALKPLANLSTLRILQIEGVPLNDTAIDTLAGLSQLEQLHVQRCGLTAKQLQTLRQALPGCQIND